MGKWKDGRRFGPGPYVLGLQRLYRGHEFPFSVPAIANIERLNLGESVTLLAGENGTGKSTILEAVAANLPASVSCRLCLATYSMMQARGCWRRC